MDKEGMGGFGKKSMAKVKMNPVVEQLRGQIGDLVFKRRGDRVIVGRKPDLTGQLPTAGQTAARDRFKQAADYGRSALANPATKSLYEAKAQDIGDPVFSVAITDFFHAPSVEEIDLSGYTGKAGETIRIQAHDDFEVAGVMVRIMGGGGQPLEAGAATRVNPQNGDWQYQTTTAIPDGESVAIEVTASDRPGNKTKKTQARP